MKTHFKTILKRVGCALTTLLPLCAAAQEPTNFILIYLDDMGYGDLGCTGAIGYETPHIDQMAAQGMRFTRYYAPQAVSGASRAGVLTGCYPNRIGMWGAPDHRSTRGISADEMTIGNVLKQKGYATAAFGKWHLGFQEEFLPLQHGFDEFYGIPYSNDMWPNHPTGSYPDLPLYDGNTVVGYNTDQSEFTTAFTEKTLDFISKNKDRPFFVYLAHPMPHVPLAVSDKFKGKSKQGLYGDVMMEIDWSVGQILQKLEEEGLSSQTLVVFTSDNGPWLNYGNHAGTTGGLREGKGVSFEGGQRVPCIMYWKGQIASGLINNQLVSGLDILPTFAEIAAAPLPKHKIDGLSLLALIRGEVKESPRKDFAYYYRKNNLEAVTDGDYKLVFPHTHRSYEGFVPANDGKPGPVNEYHKLEEPLLFDLRRDPGERYNLYQALPDVVAHLEQIAEQHRADMGDDLQGVKGANLRPAGQAK
ncbi:MAG: sulfatase family protein [Bacteroides sp.]